MSEIFCCFLLFSAFAEVYAVHVNRIDQDLYKTDGGYFIKTRFCYEYSYGEKAIYDDVRQELIFFRRLW